MLLHILIYTRTATRNNQYPNSNTHETPTKRFEIGVGFIFRTYYEVVGITIRFGVGRALRARVCGLNTEDSRLTVICKYTLTWLLAVFTIYVITMIHVARVQLG